MGDALELAEPGIGERIAVLDVVGAVPALGVVRQLLDAVAAQGQVLGAHAQRSPPLDPGARPEVEPLAGLLRRAEPLELHLLELAAAEDEVARGDLVAERLADLRDPERHAHAAGVEHVAVVEEDALRGLRAQVRHIVVAAGGADEGAEHQVELARLGERSGPRCARRVDARPLLLAKLEVGHGIDLVERHRAAHHLARRLERLLVISLLERERRRRRRRRRGGAAPGSDRRGSAAWSRGSRTSGR